MTDHTPGPWYADRNGQIWRTPPEMLQGGGGYIHDVPVAETIIGSRFNCHPHLANARLIAAAPDLLAALEMAVEDNCIYVARPETFEAALAAIAKARGNNDD